ncbi:hypothetical protein ACKKBG_A14915 [Auxenochlorella protothecoides x Auxenochlorella symbiontica]
MVGWSYLHLVLGFDAAVYTIHTWLDARQLRALRRAHPPKELAHLYPAPQDYASKQAYSLDSLCFGMARGAFDSALSAALLLSGFLPWSWNAVGHLLGGAHRPIAQAVLWTLLTSGLNATLGLPWSLARTFGLEARHGFNKTSPATFAMDALKSLGLGLALGPPLIAAVAFILERAGPWVALHLWAFLLAMSMVLMALYPSVIAPLFNSFTPLPQGQLREEIEALAASLHFPLTKLFVIDGSKRSAHSNAYMYGFWRNKRIVLYDTLIEQSSVPQVVAVLAHELGHWALGHTPRLLAAAQVQILGQLALFTALRASPTLASSFGFDPVTSPPFIAFVLFQYLSGPLDEALGCLNNYVTRRFEFQADAFGVAQGRAEDLKAALLVLDKENKSPPHTDPLYSAYHYSHPPLLERLRAIDAAVARGGSCAAEAKKKE